MTNPIDVTSETFHTEVIQSDMPVLVDFWAEWCPPCRMIAPTVKAMASEYEGILKVAKVDTDENPDLIGVYNIASIPTLMLFKNGAVVERIIGAYPKEQIVAKVLPHLAAATA